MIMQFVKDLKEFSQKELKEQVILLNKDIDNIKERIKEIKKFIIFVPKKYDLDKIHWSDVPHGIYQIKFKKRKVKDKNFYYKGENFIEIGDYEDDYNYIRYTYFKLIKDLNDKRGNFYEKELLKNCFLYTIENQYYSFKNKSIK